MSSDIAVSVQGLGKCYHIYEKPRHRLKQALFRGRRRFFREFWALKDVSFELRRGDIVGIIGRNGSGKSTLLQLIADTLTPTEGEIALHGRVTALLELGAGFNPEFTGRENVFLNGSIMGLSREQVAARYDEILAFAEIGEFIDQPVKTYSSGMFVRLAFAVAAHLDPDILIVDEALSVGDIRFQRKCFRKLEDLKSRGITILFVTHSTELVVNHCNHALCLERGRVRAIGKPRDVVNAYLDTLFGDGDAQPQRPAKEAVTPGGQGGEGGGPDMNDDPQIDGGRRRRTYNPEEYRWGDRRASIIDYLLVAGDHVDPVSCPRDGQIEITMRVHFHADVRDVIYGLTIKTLDGTTVYASNTELKAVAVRNRRAGESVVIRFAFTPALVPGDYFVSLGVAAEDPEKGTVAVDRRYDMVHLNIADVYDAFGIAELGLSIQESETPARGGNAG